MYKRRRMQKTDYKQRLALLRSGTHRFVVRRSHNGFHVQVIDYDEKGDKVIFEVSSRMLKKYGWLAHNGNTSAGYLTGLLAGMMAKKHNVKDAIADLGLQVSVKGSSVYAVIKGASDAGMNIPMGDVSPSADRISGKHVAELASKLKSHNEKYRKQFSAYLKNNVQPENLPQHFEDTKKRVLTEFKTHKVAAVAGSDE